MRRAKLTASDGEGHDNLGISVAIDGDTVVVGAWLDGHGRGSAYVFVKPASGWSGRLTESAKLSASEGTPVVGGFGESVAISGGTIVVGEGGAKVGENGFQGAAYVFVEPPGGWAGNLTETARLTASDGKRGDFLGSVAVSGGTVVVAAPGADDSQGAAYVFLEPADGWRGRRTETARLAASDGEADDRFGDHVAVSGGTVVVGASNDGIAGNDGQGSAYLFVEPAEGWGGQLTETAKLKASDGEAGDGLGRAAAVSGDTVVVGAWRDEVGGRQGQGSAYVFVEPAGGWAAELTESAKLTASDGETGDNLGVEVAIAGDMVVVGATGDTIAENHQQGSAYVFVEPEAGWAGSLHQAAKLWAADGATLDRFGFSVAVAGEAIVVGALLDDFAGGDVPRLGRDQGSAYVFAGLPERRSAGSAPGAAQVSSVSIR
jgi:hypothetical protein